MLGLRWQTDPYAQDGNPAPQIEEKPAAKRGDADQQRRFDGERPLQFVEVVASDDDDGLVDQIEREDRLRERLPDWAVGEA